MTTTSWFVAVPSVPSRASIRFMMTCAASVAKTSSSWNRFVAEQGVRLLRDRKLERVTLDRYDGEIEV
jgi:hypothetical protein